MEINTKRSTMSAVASINGQPTRQNPLVARFVKVVFQKRPSPLPYHLVSSVDLRLLSRSWVQ
ncbi:hypothetical protein E2C01_093914 [Portunus trituberculatus]|uniref:Uncharacterized protein n=1 Tax=Portunus trituberculatus TaxID=210409 RepID=A0A5B7JP08_PORTR|nr:hypothetical protein [Portunus trituberculatus]